MAQAYIFAGEDFDAVRRYALKFAVKLNGEKSPDTVFVKKSKETGVGVGDVREQIIMPVGQKPFNSPHKIFIVDEPLLPAAQNALLKTIEEPPPYGVFLFLAQNTHGFLPTVISRCIVKKIEAENAVATDALAEEIFAAVQGADITAAFALYAKISPLEKDELQEFLKALYILCGKARHFAAADAVSHTKKILSQNANAQLAIELMLLKMR